MKASWDAFYPCVDKPKLNSTYSGLLCYVLKIVSSSGCHAWLFCCTHAMQHLILKFGKRRGDFIQWEKRNHNLPKEVAIYLWCKVAIDSTYFRIGEPVPFNFKVEISKKDRCLRQVQSSCVHLSIGAIIYLDLCTSC